VPGTQVRGHHAGPGHSAGAGGAGLLLLWVLMLVLQKIGRTRGYHIFEDITNCDNNNKKQGLSCAKLRRASGK